MDPHEHPGDWLVVPCYNEAARLDPAGFAALHGHVQLLFVDDGSTDATLSLLRSLGEERPGVHVLPLSPNRGKAEAVRAGMVHAIARGALAVGYFDADLATPAEEMLRLHRTMVERDVMAAFGSRIRLLGRDISRPLVRHWLGRGFATAASTTLRLPIYDTQCGAKWFRVDDTLRWALSRAFMARWAFDVELIGRLLYPGGGCPPWHPSSIVEMPLRQWTDVEGSRVTRRAFLRAGLDLSLIALDLERRRRRLNRASPEAVDTAAGAPT